MRALAARSWPGNVRELEAWILRALLTRTPGARLGPDAIEADPAKPADREAVPGSSKRLLERPLAAWRDELDRRYLRELFAATRGDVRAMLERLRIRRTTLYEWFRRLGIDPRRLREELEPPAAR